MRFAKIVQRAAKRFRALCGDERGVAALELAAVAGPIVIGIVVGGDMAMRIHTSNRLASAANAAAQYAAVAGYDKQKIIYAAQNATSLRNVTITVTDSYCACPSSRTLVKTYCSNTCPAGLSAARYADVKLNTPFKPMFKINGSEDKTLTAQATVRVQ